MSNSKKEAKVKECVLQSFNQMINVYDFDEGLSKSTC